MSIDRWDLVDGTILTSTAGHRVMIDGMAGPYLKIVDADGALPLDAPGWMAIGPYAMVEHVEAGRWSIVPVGAAAVEQDTEA